jgi:hypothetical protein
MIHLFVLGDAITERDRDPIPFFQFVVTQRCHRHLPSVCSFRLGVTLSDDYEKSAKNDLLSGWSQLRSSHQQMAWVPLSTISPKEGHRANTFKRCGWNIATMRYSHCSSPPDDLTAALCSFIRTQTLVPAYMSIAYVFACAADAPPCGKGVAADVATSRDSRVPASLDLESAPS